MFFDPPLHLSNNLLSACGTKASIHYSERVPATKRVLVISNHRSFLDAPLLMAAMNPTAIKVFQEIEEVGLTPQLELPAVTIGLIRKFLNFELA